MKKKLSPNKANDISKQTGHQISLKTADPVMEIKLDAIKPWKDNHEHEKVRRQRQDLFDNWEHVPKKSL